METMASRARSVLFEPRTTFREVESEFTKPGAIWGKYILPLAAIGPIAGAIGRLVFGQRIALTTLTSSVSISDAITWAIISYLLALAAVFVLTQVISLLAPGFGGQKNDVQALKVAAYASTPVWLAGVFSLIPALSFLGILGLYGLYLLWLGLPVLMKTPPEKSIWYTITIVVVAIVVTIVILAVLAVIGLRSFR